MSSLSRTVLIWDLVMVVAFLFLTASSLFWSSLALAFASECCSQSIPLSAASSWLCSVRSLAAFSCCWQS